MHSQNKVARPRAHGGPPVLSSTFGYKTIVGSEQNALILCNKISCRELYYYDRLPDQQPSFLQEKKQETGEANNFDLKSCPTNWVHLKSTVLHLI